MGHVGAVIALALHNESLRPDHFFHGTDPSGGAEGTSGFGVSKPIVIDHGDAISGAENDIDKIIPAINFCQPMGESQLCPESRSLQMLESGLNMSRAHENIQILGIAPNPGVIFQGKGASDEKGDPCLGQVGQYLPVKGSTSNG
jgi:hypothetical protein